MSRKVIIGGIVYEATGTRKAVTNGFVYEETVSVGGLTEVVKQASFSWDIEGQVVKQSTFTWDALNQVNKQSLFSWDLLAEVNKQTSFSWDVLNEVVKSSSFLWNIEGTAGEVTKQTNFVWNLSNLSITNVANFIPGQTTTITTDGYIDLTTVTSISVTYNSVVQADTVATASNTCDFTLDADGHEVGASANLQISITI